MLAYLRQWQRRVALAVVLVHHARKGADRARGGQALRGSSELHGWGDSNLYLRRIDDRLLLSIEHRAAPSTGGLPLALRGADGALALHFVDATAAPAREAPPSPIARVENVPAHGNRLLSLAELRQACRMRTASLGEALATLTAQGRVHKSVAGYQRIAVSLDLFPAAPYRRRETETGHGRGRAPDRGFPIRSTRLASVGDRAPLASDPSTTEDSRRTTGRASSAGPSLRPVVLAGANEINAPRESSQLPGCSTDGRRPSIRMMD